MKLNPPSAICRKVAKHIRQHRQDCSISLCQLARRSGLHKAQLSRIESGNSSNPTLSTLCAIANAFSCRVEDLITGEIVPF